MTLPPSIDDFYKARSSKKRTQLRSLSRRLEKSYPGDVKIDIIQDEAQIEQFCEDAEEISSMTYQFKKGEGFVNNTETQMLLKLLAEKGKLWAYILYVEDQPCAYWVGFIHNSISYGPPAGTGYNPQFGKYEVGTILLLRMIEDLCKNDQVQYIDFGVLDAYYKRRFCDINWNDASFYIFQPSIKGIGLNSLWILFRSFHWFGNLIIDRLRLRQKWRKFTRTF
jgi:hypothetical protein